MSLLPYKVTAIKDFDATGQNVMPLASVSVLVSGGGYASLKTDSTGSTPLANPFTCDANGEKEFWILGGEYQIVVDGGQAWDIILSGASDIQSVATFAALASTPATAAGQVVYVVSHTSGGFGGGEFRSIAAAHTATNGWSYINSATVGFRWERVNYAVPTPQDFGSIGDGVVDDSDALQLMLDAGVNIKGRPGYTYKTTKTLYLTNDNIEIDFGWSKIQSSAGIMYAVVIVTDELAAKTEADLLDVLNNLHYGDEVENSHIKNLIVELSPTSSGGSNLGAGIAYGKNCTFDGLIVTQTNGNGFEIRNSTNCGLIGAVLTPRAYGMFNFMTKDCYAKNVNVSGCDRGIITKMSQAGAPVNFRASNCIVENLTNTLYYTVGGEFKETVLTDPIYETGHEVVSDVFYDNCIFRSSIGTVKVDLSYWAGRFTYTGCKFESSAVAGVNAGLSGNQLPGDVQGKDHKFVACTFLNTSTTGAVALSIGSDTTFEACTFNGAFQRLLRTDGTYNAHVKFCGNFISGEIEASALLEHAVLSSLSGSELTATDNDIKLTAKAGTGVICVVSFGLKTFNDNDVVITGSSTYDANPLIVSTGTAKDNDITINGMDAIDAITVTDAGLICDNKLTHDGTSSGTARGVYASSGSVQVKEISGNRFYGFDSGSTGVLGNNVQYPVYADEAAAATGTLASGRFYKSSDGIMRVKA